MAYETSAGRSSLDPSGSADRPPVAREGDIIDGKYRVERVIGEGGMGLVVAAKHTTLNSRVAIKLLSPKSQESTEALQRFKREAQAASAIKSEHVGKVHDVDTLESGAPYIVMELLEGHDLSEELRRSKMLPLTQAVMIILQACEAVAEAHAVGVVHRDLKPANLFLSRNEEGRLHVKVLDFGISKITRNEPSKEITLEKVLTSANTMLGSPLYMSPEQMQASGDVDLRTDIWSLGVILYEMLTGRSPFDAATIPMICANVLSLPPPPLGIAGAPEGLERVVFRCLEKDPAKRYRDVAHLARSLAPFAPEQAKITLDRIYRLRGPDGLPAATPPSLHPPPHREGSATITSWGERGVAKPGRRWIPLALAGGVCAMILSAIGVQVLLGERAPAAHDPASTGRATAPAVTSEPDAVTTAPPAETAAPAETATPAGTASAAGSASAKAPIAPVRPPGGGRWQPPPSKQPRGAGFGGRE